MKRLLIFVILSGVFSVINGQDLVERICLEICSCIDTIENMDSLQTKLDRCFPKSMEVVWNSQEDINEDLELFMDDTVQKTIDIVISKLTYYCPEIRKFIIADKEARYYRMSDSDKANGFYLEGNKAFESGDFKTAEKKYLKAIKTDPGWIYPYDNLGLAYRKDGQYDKAVKYYSKSLGLYPEGSIALQNQAVAYTSLNDNISALKNYNALINLYPSNPEGFFGTAKVHFQNGDYEMALDFALYAHRMYLSQKSEYIKDSEKLISEIHDKMKEQDKLEIFNERLRKFGIKIGQN